MAYGNNVTVTGNLTRDIELRYTPGGQALGKGGIALYGGKDAQGNEKPAHFVDFVIWGDQAANAAQSLKKGTRVMIEGKLQQERWEKDGAKRSKVTITVDDIAASVRWATVEVAKAEYNAPPTGDGNDADEAPF